MAKSTKPAKSIPAPVKSPPAKAEGFEKKLLKNFGRELLYLLIITILYIPIYNHIFDKKVAILGDNAAYYILGKAMANGDGFVQANLISKPKATHFPPGYPAFMSVVMNSFGDEVTVLKKANGVLLWLSLVILFFFFRNISKNIHLSFVIVLALVFNMHLLQYGTWMMSEIPFLLISSLSLFLLTISDLNKKPWMNWAFILTVIVTAASYYVRGQGLAVFAGLFLFLLFAKKWIHAGFAAVLYFLLLLPWHLRNSGLPESSYSKALKLKNYYDPSQGLMETGDWFDRFFTNMERYFKFEIPSSVFGYVADYQSSGVLFGGLVFSIIVFIGFLKLKQYRWAVGGYLLATFGILFLWPEIWNGIRFILAIVPLLTFLFAFGVIELILLAGQKMKIKLSEKIPQRLSFAFLILIPIFFGKIEDLNKEANRKYDPLFRNYFELAKWTKNNLPDSSVVVCRKPNLFYLESGHFTEGFSKVEGIDKFLVTFQKKKATHVVIYGDGITQRYFLPAYQKNQEKFKPIRQMQNPDMWLMEYHPELGYQGEWVNGMKEGKGIYVYQDGRKYEGEWKNDQQNGRGILYDSQGKIIAEGFWENGVYKTISN